MLLSCSKKLKASKENKMLMKHFSSFNIWRKTGFFSVATHDSLIFSTFIWSCSNFGYFFRKLLRIYLSHTATISHFCFEIACRNDFNFDETNFLIWLYKKFTILYKIRCVKTQRFTHAFSRVEVSSNGQGRGHHDVAGRQEEDVKEKEFDRVVNLKRKKTDKLACFYNNN